MIENRATERDKEAVWLELRHPSRSSYRIINFSLKGGMFLHSGIIIGIFFKNRVFSFSFLNSKLLQAEREIIFWLGSIAHF